MSIEIIQSAVNKGAKLYASISGGKDGQAMVKALAGMFKISGLVHADLGRVEWPESHEMCQRQSNEFNVPLYVVRRSDGADMLAHWRRRLEALKGTDKPFWSSSKQRYCTSDLKRGPINKFFTSCENFIISCEGIRAEESTERGKKEPLTIRWEKTSSYYAGMTVEQAIASYTPSKRLSLTWFPIFNFKLADVWATYGMTESDAMRAKMAYSMTGQVPEWWPFHPAYAMGNERVSCVFCIMGSMNDLKNGAKHHPELLEHMIQMEEEGNATFKNNWSLKELRTCR